MSEKGGQFTSRFFEETCQIIGSRSLCTTTYHPKSNGQVARFKRTIISAIRHYGGDHPRQWDAFMNAPMYTYDTQVLRTTKLAPVLLVPLNFSCHLYLETEPPGGTTRSAIPI